MHRHARITRRLPYKVYHIDAKRMEQKEPWFLAINPNGRIPALTDTCPSDGQPIALFESGSVMQYLVATYDTEYRISYPPGTRGHFETTNWLFWQNAGVGPMQGQANHFVRYSGERIEYAIDRYTTEIRRLYGVLEKRLMDVEGQGGYVVPGGKCTIADISLWGWIVASGWAGVGLDEFPGIKRWEERMAGRDGVERGRHVPERHTVKEILADKEKMRDLEERGKKWNEKSKKVDKETVRENAERAKEHA